MEKLSPLEKYGLETDLKNRSPSLTLWRPFIFFKNKPNDESITKLESSLGVTLPDDFKNDLKLHGGHIPALNNMAAQIVGGADDENDEDAAEEAMGPLYHCVDDCDPDFEDYHILTHPLTQQQKGKLLVISETSSGHPIVMTFPENHILVLYQNGTALAGENWTDFLWRMRLENRNRIRSKLNPPQIVCDSCGDVVTDAIHYHCSVCESFDLCEPCQAKGVVTEEHTEKHKMNRVDPKSQLDLLKLLQPMTPYDFDLTPSEEDKLHRAQVNESRRRFPISTLLYFKWDDDKYAEFERLLNFDRRLNLASRMDYYTEKGFLTDSHYFVDVPLRQERHAVWLPSDPESGNLFGYSIGAFYLFNDPEILVIHRGSALNARQTALTVNYIRTASLFEKKVTAGMTLGDIIEHFPPDQIDRYKPFSACQFVPADVETRKKYLGFGSWFNCNFMDTLNFPALVIELTDQKAAEAPKETNDM